MEKRNINPQKKMDLVIHAARKLFVEKGYRGVAIPEIVKESGVSVGAIYLHFGNKEKLAETVYQKTLQQFMELFSERLANKKSVQEKLKAFAELVFEITEEDSEMMEYMLSVRKEIRSKLLLPLCSSDAFTEVQRIIDSGVVLGEIKPGSNLTAAISYTGVILRAADLRLQGFLKQPLQDIADELIENAWSSIAAK
ncbi:MAG: TetR/AcrR family transcriptional regulator [Deltaproteobacteria bacterium]|nr:TetR/AcrR family transcriptional regulator [Deltaproteobacteria bacterium]MCW8894081.1 TetR/AcrR family transcriptional regulator [Deltaproteobacteria bacterium]